MTAPRIEPALDGSPLGATAGASHGASGATRLAERAVLAALLHQPDHMADLELWLQPSDFDDPQHAATYTIIAALRAAGELHPFNAVDNVLAVQHAARYPTTQPTSAGLRDLLTAVPSHGPDLDLHVRYGQMVLESSARRRLQAWAVYFEQPTTAPEYGADTREFSAVHDGLTADLADLQQRTAQSSVSRDLATFADLSGTDTPTLDGPLVVPAAAPAHKLVERAERDVLTAVLSDATGRHQAVHDHLEPGDFTASPRHAATWRAIQAVVRRGEPVNAITVAWEAERLPTEHGAALSAEELVDLAGAPPPHHLRRQTATIARASLYYRVQQTGGQLDRAAHDRSRSVDQVLTEAQGTAANLREQASRLAGERRPAAAARIAQQLDGPTTTRQR